MKGKRHICLLLASQHLILVKQISNLPPLFKFAINVLLYVRYFNSFFLGTLL